MKDGVYAYRLTKVGEPGRLVLWAESSSKEAKIANIESVTTLLGTPCLFAPQGTVLLNDEPIWIRLK